MSIIMVGTIKGGVGKTTTSQSICVKLAQEGVSTVLIDLDETKSAMKWSSDRQSHGHEPSITVIQNLINPVQTVIDMAKKFDVVVIDVGARDIGSIATFARICDLWVIPAGVGQKELDATVDLFNQFESQHQFHKDGRIPMACFFSCVPTRNTSEEPDAREFLEECVPNIPLLKSITRDRKAFTDADKLGLSVIEMRGRDSLKAVKETEQLIAELFSKMKTGE